MTSRMLQIFDFEFPPSADGGLPLPFTADDVGVTTSLIMAPKSFPASFKVRNAKVGALLESEWAQKIQPRGDSWTD
jgi:hypothetical protein